MKRKTPRSRTNLNLVGLEDRSVPATFTVTSFLDLDAMAFDPATGKLPTGEVTLRSAILAANATAGADTVIAPAGTYNLTINGAEDDSGLTGDLDILDSVTLELTGAIVDASAIGDRVLDVDNATASVTITGGTFQGGKLASPNLFSARGGEAGGGGIQNAGSLTLNGTTITNNQTLGIDGDSQSSAGNALGGGISSSGSLTVNGGEITFNTARGGAAGNGFSFAGTAFGGGLYSNGTVQLINVRIAGNGAFGGTGKGQVEGDTVGEAYGGGAYIDSISSNTITGSRIDNNQAVGGTGTLGSNGGFASGGGLVANGSIEILNSTIDSNLVQGGLAIGDTVLGASGGDALGGGATINSAGSVNVLNTTVSGNRAAGGDGSSAGSNSFGGGGFGGGIYSDTSFSSGALLSSVTITDNEATPGVGIEPGSADGGGLVNSTFVNGPAASLRSTIVAGNRAETNPDVANPGNFSVGQPLNSFGSNLIGISDGTQGFVDGVNGDQVGTDSVPLDPLLTPLGFFGGNGLALVHALNIGSPARDTGTDGELTTDQRGTGFERIINGTADVGAFEVQIPSTVTQSVVGPLVAGQPFTITGTVTDPRFPPTGTVEFFVNGSSVGTAMLDSAGNASITATVTSAGTLTVSIAYGGDAAYLGASSSESTFVAISATTSSVSASPNPSLVTQPITFVSAVSSADPGTPTGTVQFFVDGNPFGAPVALDAAGSATLIAPTGFAIGAHQVSSTYSGDANFATSTAGPVPFAVNPSPTTTGVTVVPSSAFVTEAFDFTATVTGQLATAPTGTVQFLVDGAPFGAPVVLDGNGVATLAAPTGFAIGTHQVSATYTGSANFTPSSAAPVAFTVTIAPSSTAVGVAPNPVFATDPIFLTATVTGSISALPTGTVTFLVDGTSVGTATLDANGQTSLTLPAGLQIGDGNFDVVASYGGDANFQGSNSPVTVLSVIPVPTRTTLTVDPQSAMQGTAITLTADVAFNIPQTAPQRAGIDPTILNGTVNFFNGTTPLGSAPISNGTATLVVTNLPVGTNTISAVFVPATGNLATSTGTASVTIAARATIREVFAAGSGYGIISTVKVYDPDGNELAQFQPYGPDYWCGIVTATGDVTGDGVEDIIVGTAISGGPHVKVFDGVTFNLIAEFFAYDPAFRGGVSVGAGDLDGDGVAEIVTGAGPGGGPQVNIYSFTSAGIQLVNSYFAYEPDLRSGITVAVSGGLIATGPGFTGGPHVKVFGGIDASLVASYFAFDPNSRNGVNVALSFDGTRIVLTAGTDAGRLPLVQTFDATTGQPLDSQMVYEPGFLGGVTVTNVRTLPGESRTVFGTGLGGGPRVRIFGPGDVLVKDFFVFGEDFRGGVFVG